MQRTQIYLAAEDVELLDRAAARTGASRSELIRRAVRERYGKTDREARIALLRSSFGAWRDFPLTGEEFVERIRGDLNERLEQLGWS
ncbi:MAG: CopG family transcriptional regulator [Egibacteraceae bacterium]